MAGWVVEYPVGNWSVDPDDAVHVGVTLPLPSVGVAFASTQAKANALAWHLGGIARPTRQFEIPVEFKSVGLQPTLSPSAKLISGWATTATLSWALSAMGVLVTDDEGAGVVVGVVDTGVHSTHADLPCVLSMESFVNAPADKDDVGHGTFAIGLIAGAKQPANGGPRYGIAPKARVRSYRVYGNSLQTDESTIAAGIEKAITDGCRIICLASGVRTDSQTSVDARLAALARANGALLFAAAGNDSNRTLNQVVATRAPANAAGVFAFGAATDADKLWNKSNGKTTDTARRVDFVAAGDDVLSSFNHGSTTILATGTSIATAAACGVAAAVWSRDLTQTPAAVLAKLRELAKPIVGAPLAGVGDGSLRVRT